MNTERPKKGRPGIKANTSERPKPHVMTVRHLELKLHRKDSIRTGMTFLGPAPQAPKPPTTELPRGPAGCVKRLECGGQGWRFCGEARVRGSEEGETGEGMREMRRVMRVREGWGVREVLFCSETR